VTSVEACSVTAIVQAAGSLRDWTLVFDFVTADKFRSSMNENVAGYRTEERSATLVQLRSNIAVHGAASRNAKDVMPLRARMMALVTCEKWDGKGSLGLQ
jgi:hypothetical protein